MNVMQTKSLATGQTITILDMPKAQAPRLSLFQVDGLYTLAYSLEHARRTVRGAR